MPELSVEAIDAVLPQTQCGLCSYGGCLPYAKAIVAGDTAINRCPPGGVKVLQTLGELTGQSVVPYVAAMQAQAKPAQVAIINEALCIGCTKCIAVCPVDAILGAPKRIHGILTEACTGCGLCLPPCPMDCIALVSVDEPIQVQRDAWRLRHQRHLSRVEKKIEPDAAIVAVVDEKTNDALSYIAAALARKKAK
jgi:electron transport complex protein RnfB